MPTIHWDEINWLAVLVAGIASFVLGGVWYGVIFGKAWARIYAYTPEQIAQMQKSQGPTMGVLAACDLAFAVGLGVVGSIAGVTSLAGGLMLGFVLWLGIVATQGLAAHVASMRPIRGFAIDYGKKLASLLVAGAIIGAWQ